MTLDVEIPDPPTLHGSQSVGNFDAVDEPEERAGDNARREALADFLETGAWDDAFDEWAGDTYLTDGEFRAVLELGLIDRFDFYWNEAAADVGYRAPTVPADSVAAHDELDEGDVDDIEEALDSLGRTVSEVLETDYIHRTGEEFGYTWE
ncbi:hypothetical protein [Natrinema salaciae]|uniref:DUF7992 domain-containing protein n=1 Tax=Natrinema salaciae TaxID=1186196 RepID=A0A1H9F563_9EURY|nr:hypothetical protein [Natrinema salaciae]SEQ32398.1 hypothetical protein SAMN04489841_1456 [Natrinema salaciae]